MENPHPRDEGRRQRPGTRTFRPAGVLPPDPGAAPQTADRATERFSAVAHEIGNLLDGAFRYLALARRDIIESGQELAEEGAARQIGIAESALGRVAHLVRHAMRPGVGSLASCLSEPRPLIDAVLHAREVLQPMADERNITIHIEFSPRLVLTPAGPIYTVVANAVRNAIEAAPDGGRIEIIAELSTMPSGEPEVQIDVLDDGVGPPRGAGECVFDIGFTTKSGGLGVGLALSREIMHELGGEIALGPRASGGGRDRSGAHLRICYPAPAV
ncbi:MAG: sensor histidine kinase [Phycisphaeraceae bacterium]|nr:MAG: sensor histidine kinase [Phycisphaeraceae bacterium]